MLVSLSLKRHENLVSYVYVHENTYLTNIQNIFLSLSVTISCFVYTYTTIKTTIVHVHHSLSKYNIV